MSRPPRALFLALACAAALAGCQGSAPTATPAGADPAEQSRPRKALPAYATVARAYNERVALLGRLFARTVVVIKFTDEDGKRRSEQGEGFLQIVRPDKLAMSVSKVGKRLVWFGSDEQRYWWIDLVDRKRAYVGRHDNYDTLRARGVIEPGLGLRPLDLIQMLGTSPLPLDGDKPLGAVQWSSDGQRLGITVRRDPAPDAGLMRVWINPDTYEASLVELFDAAKQVVLVANLADYEHVELRNRGGNAPRVASRILIAGPEGGPLNGSELRMSLEGIEDHRVSDDAFRLDIVLDEVGVAREDVVDLDREPPRRAAAPPGADVPEPPAPPVATEPARPGTPRR